MLGAGPSSAEASSGVSRSVGIAGDRHLVDEARVRAQAAPRALVRPGRGQGRRATAPAP